MVGEVRAWLHELRRTDPTTLRQISAALDLLAADGPTLGRPMVDRVKGSALHRLKELRPGSTGGSEIRILFAFDPASRAVLLVAGDKAGNWRRWYRYAIPLAEERFERWMKELDG
ncbi:MAG: type II toxin-antitoxin system RelE/ParE family toxin [Pseudonocardia sp.]|nr:type II toxin-antitoxin system RelE/ParE family toxin [Pseudonocardia sp.]